MSFEESYKNEMDTLVAGESVKRSVRARLRGRESDRNRPRAPLFRAASFALCALLACGVGLYSVNLRGTVPAKQPTATVSDYQTLYDTVKSLLPKRYGFWGGKYYVTEDSAVAVNESVGVAATKSATAATGDFSGTTRQVEDVDEADIVKTDGRYLYRLSHRYEEDSSSLVIVDTAGSSPEVVCSLPLSRKDERRYETMYVAGDRLILIGYDYSDFARVKTPVAFYDISDRRAPRLIAENLQCGGMSDSRMVGDRLYLISDYSLGVTEPLKDNPLTFAPFVQCGEKETPLSPDSICLYRTCRQAAYTVVCDYSADGALLDSKAVLGGSYAVYCNTETLLAAGFSFDGTTPLFCFKIEKDAVALQAEGEIKGSLLNQFSMDEHGGCFRFVTTYFEEKSGQTVNLLTVLDGSLSPLGQIDNIAPGERVYSVRFMGETGYFVTFRQVDPLFSVDLRNPRHPEIIGSLKIPGFSDYLFPYGAGKLLGIGQNADETTGKTDMMKLSLFDISNPAEVTEQFKTDVNAFSSEALYNHKACLVNAEKNLVGFAGDYEEATYYLYTLKENGFSLLAEIPLAEKESCRGVYIGDTFYIVGSETLLYFDLDRPESVRELSFF